jgi:hypothetical protein
LLQHLTTHFARTATVKLVDIDGVCGADHSHVVVRDARCCTHTTLQSRAKKTESIKAMIRRSSRCQSSELFYSIKLQFLFKKKKPRTGVVLIRQPLVVPTNTMLKTEMSVTQATEFPAPKLPMLRDETQVEEIH